MEEEKQQKQNEEYQSMKKDHDLVGFLLTCKKMMNVIEENEDMQLKAIKAGKIGNKKGDSKQHGGSKKQINKELTLSEELTNFNNQIFVNYASRLTKNNKKKTE